MYRSHNLPIMYSLMFSYDNKVVVFSYIYMEKTTHRTHITSRSFNCRIKPQPHEANWKAESSTSYELGWLSVNRQRFPVHSWQVEGPTEIVGVYSVGQWQRKTFLAEYLNWPCLKNKGVLLDTFIVHFSREQTLVSQGAPVWHHELAFRKSWRCVRLDYRSRVAEA